LALILAGVPLIESQSQPAPGPRIAPLAGDYVRGRIVVRFVPSVSEDSMMRLAGVVSATGVTHPSYADFNYVEIPPALDPVEAARRMSEQAGVVYALPDPIVYPLRQPNDEFYRFQWHFQRIGMEQAWDINPGGGRDVVVAVLDTGVAFTDVRLRYPRVGVYEFERAPDLRGTPMVAGFDFVWNSEFPVDTDGHGTHVAGTVAQTTDNGSGGAGMAYNTTLMPVKVLTTDFDLFAGLRFPSGASAVSRGIRFAVEGGAKVINMSLGGPAPSNLMRDALQFAVDNGVFVAIAAGNSAQDPECPNCPEWPASYASEFDGVMAVAALDFDFERAPYSTFQDYVEIAAPGGDVTEDRNGDRLPDGVLQETLVYATLSRRVQELFGPFLPAEVTNPRIFTLFQPDIEFQGTSMASPHVAGFAALLYDQGITSPAAIEAAIKRFASDVGPAGRDVFTGYGVLNPRETLRGLGLAR
jgi:serine protease